MKYSVYSQKNGELIIPDEVKEPIFDIISKIEFDEGKTPNKDVRRQIVEEMQKKGWSGVVKLSVDSNISITSMNRKIGACVQFGNIGRMYADLLKLQTMYQKDIIEAGIMIMPNNDPEAKNSARATRLQRELAIYGTVITMPMIIIGVGV